MPEAGYRILEASAPGPLKHVLLGGLGGGATQHFVATLGHWLVRPYRIIERIGPVRAPALLIGVGILLLAFNLVTAALVLAAVMWILFLYPSVTIPYACWRARRDNNRQRGKTRNSSRDG